MRSSWLTAKGPCSVRAADGLPQHAAQRLRLACGEALNALQVELDARAGANPAFWWYPGHVDKDVPASSPPPLGQASIMSFFEHYRMGVPILPLDANACIDEYRVERMPGGTLGIRLSLRDVHGISDAELEALVLGNTSRGGGGWMVDQSITAVDHYFCPLRRVGIVFKYRCIVFKYRCIWV
mgnify:CR=1 FL=1